MKLADIVAAAQGKPARFRSWLAYAIRREAEIAADGTIKQEYLKDGAGLTICGMTSRDDGISQNPTSHEIVKGYEKYWNRCYAETLPIGVGEALADISLLCGFEQATLFLQRGITDQGQKIAVDGKVGPITIEAAWKCESTTLAGDIIEQSREYFRKISKTGNRARFLNGWLARADALQEFIEA